MEQPPQRAQDTPKRLREVYRYLRSAHSGVDLTSYYTGPPPARLPPEDHVPQPSPDPALTAFAQLGALRLNCARALISLLDTERQYVLAEATATLSLRHAQQHQTENPLWLGNSSIPRNQAVCQSLLDGSTNSNDGIVVIPDLLQDEHYGNHWFVKNGPCCRFYASAPIVSREGYVVGSYCVFDDEPRSTASNDELMILLDLAATTMQYLESLLVREENRRAEALVRGLASFVEGKESLQLAGSNSSSSPYQDVTNVDSVMHVQSLPVPSELPTRPDRAEAVASTLQAEHTGFDEHAPRLPANSRLQIRQANPSEPSTSNAHSSVSTSVSGGSLSKGTEDMFSRAANIIRQCCELDGVVFFDATSTSVGRTRREPGRRKRRSFPRENTSSSSLTDESSESSSSIGTPSAPHKSEMEQRPLAGSGTSDSDDPTARSCRILGYATDTSSSLALDLAPRTSRSFPVLDLEWLLRRHPGGSILNFTESGELSSADESDLSRDSNHASATSPKHGRQKSRAKSIGEAVRSVARGARSVAFLPLWDYERSRWFAACVLWTTQVNRVLSPRVELLYLRAFGNSVMTELSRLDARASERMKTTFVASISHELRTPLHGILGGAQFLKESSLSFFQTDMLDSIESCSVTLLDIVNHVLDYSKINEFRKQAGSVSSGRKSRRPLSSKTLIDQKRPDVESLTSPVDLSSILEEVVETTFAGQSFALTTARFDDEHWDQSKKQKNASTRNRDLASIAPFNNRERKQILVLLDIPKRPSWTYKTALGAWRRIIMNIVGNALKYTEAGHVMVSLQVDGKNKQGSLVKLIVSDTGIGMSEYFVQNKLFTAFSQENSFSVGTGLGLNIVKQLVAALGGTIDVRSQQGSGTVVTISIPSVEAEESEPNSLEPPLIDKVARRVQDYRIGILEPSSSGSAVDSQHNPADARRTDKEKIHSGPVIKKTLEDWFGINAHYCTSQWDGSEADVIFCTEPSFEALASVRANRKSGKRVPVMFFLTMDTVETTAFRSDSRVTSKESVVEIMTQPCGPRKLAKALNHALDRYDTASENVEATGNDPPVPTNVTLHRESSTESLLDSPSSINILVVDDNPINRRLLVTFLKRKKLSYREASDGLQALTMYKAAKPAFNLVLMDMSMPVMDGMTSTSEIRKHERSHGMTPATIVAITGLASAAAQVEAMNSGVDAFLTKPLRLDVLASFINITADV